MPVEIENLSPWNTEDLVRFLTPLAAGTVVTKIVVGIAQPQPGVKKDEQRLVWIESTVRGGQVSDTMAIDLLSPKRAADRTEVLSRLSVTGDLQPHESVLPDEVIATIIHSFETVRTNRGKLDNWQLQNHVRGRCGCEKPLPDNLKVVIRGDTKAKTAPTYSIDQLENKLYYARREVAKYRKRLEKALMQEDRLVARIEKQRAKEGR